MMTAIAVLLLLGAIGNAVWASEGGHFKSAANCATDAMVWLIVGFVLLLAVYVG